MPRDAQVTQNDQLLFGANTRLPYHKLKAKGSIFGFLQNWAKLRHIVHPNKKVTDI